MNCSGYNCSAFGLLQRLGFFNRFFDAAHHVERLFRQVVIFAINDADVYKRQGLGKSLKKVNGEWVAETPEGPVKVRFTERNEFGVLDHWVYPKPGLQIYIPMRVIPNGSGCELIFTLFRLPAMSDEKFVADAEWVMRDLTSLKNLLESP